MKIKALIVLILFPGCLFAQKFEIGLGGGISTNTAPTANMPYKSDVYILNYAANLKLLMNIENNLQVGIEGSLVPLQGKTTHSYYNYNTHVSIEGSDNKKLVYSRTTPAAMAVANYKINLGASYFYGGVGIGYAETEIDHNLHSDETYLTPEGGHGYVTGLQIGYNYYFTDHFAIDVQAAARYYQFFYDAHIPTGTNGIDQAHLHYGIADFPATIGIRYRFLHKDHDGGRGNRMMGDDDSSQRSKKSRSGKSKHMYW